jgi:pimeloyl-ACP methyl ester carboxylesterase
MTSKGTWRSPDLGDARELTVGGARLRVHEAGSGPTIVFAHGVLVNANLWRKVVARLSSSFRCVTLDLPLGSHLVPVGADVDVSPRGLARVVAGTLEALDLDDVTLVGNDTGGALCQLTVTSQPERVGRLVLTSCDYRENFLPPMFDYLKLMVRAGPLIPALLAPMRLRAPRRLPFAFGWLTHRPIDRDAEDSYVLPALENVEIRRDLKRVVLAIDPQSTIEAADRLGSFTRPALIAWSRDDRLFKLAHAERLARELPRARLEWIDDSGPFSPEDQPERLAELIGAFAREPAQRSAAS